MTFDFTITDTSDSKSKESKMQYELEIEIHDLNPFIDNINIRPTFDHLVMRFLQNAASVMKGLSMRYTN